MPGFLKAAPLLAAIACSACAQTPTPEASQPAPTPAPTPAPAQAPGRIDPKAYCEASKAAAAIGQSPSAEVVEQARVQAGAKIVRTLRHDQPITKEYRIGRLNLVLDAGGKIASVNCS